MSNERTGDDYTDFMEKAQAKFKERNEILHNSTPSTKEKLLKSIDAENVVMPKKPISSDSKPIDVPTKRREAPKPPVIEKSDQQHVKENINKFERIAASNDVSEKKEDCKPISVKEMKRRFENDSTAVFPNQGPNPKSPKVCFPSPARHNDLPVKSPKVATPSSVHNVSQHKDHLQMKSPQKPATPVSIAIEESQVIEEDEIVEPPSIDILPVGMSKSPISLFDERLRRTMEPLTPRRARLMDEINEDYQKHSDSLPRKTSRIVNFDDDETDKDDSLVVSLQQYRQETLDRMATSSNPSIERLTYTSPVHAKDEADNVNLSQRTSNRIHQLDEFVKVCQAQFYQAKNALNYTIKKQDKDEKEFIATNHILLNHKVVLEAAMRVRDTLRYQSSSNKKLVTKLPEMRASFAFHSIDFELNPEFLHELCVDGSSCYFAIVIGYNETTRCSQHICYRKNNKCRMSVEFYCAINNVEPGFNIYVQVYMLKIPKAVPEKHNKFIDTVGTLLRGDKQSRQSDPYADDSPQFMNVGTAVINDKNMRQKHFTAETSNVLAPRFDIKFKYHISESSYHLEGYLRRFETVAGVGNWAMEYMAFNSWFLESWITHREKTEGKPAIRNMNLRECTNVGEVSDSACYPHAFFVECKTEAGKQERLLFAARSKEEQDQWLKVLKSFVDGLKYWR